MFDVERQEVVKKYSPMWEILDPAHRIDHFDSVFNTGVFLMSRFSLDIDPKEIFVVSYFHDLFTWSRNNHHLLSEAFVRTTNCPLVKNMLPSEEAINRVALACREHRASWTGGYSGPLSMLMACADRGIPKTAQVLLDRAVLYSIKHSPEDTSLEEIHRSSVEHIKEKYGRNGYAKIPDVHKKMFEKEYEILYQEIDKLY
jgi:hypothetical protein